MNLLTEYNADLTSDSYYLIFFQRKANYSELGWETVRDICFLVGGAELLRAWYIILVAICMYFALLTMQVFSSFT